MSEKCIYIKSDKFFLLVLPPLPTTIKQTVYTYISILYHSVSRYQCMWTAVDAYQRDRSQVPQFYGKVTSYFDRSLHCNGHE